jgi:hypothetical protein
MPQVKMRKLVVSEVEPFVVSLVLALGVALAGCASPQSSGSAYPSGNAYPGEPRVPVFASPFPSVISTPLASKGTVFGRLISATPGKSLTGLAVYLGTLVPLTPGPGYLITVDLTHSLRDFVREDGRFIIQNVEPGEYVLMLWTPHNSRPVPDPANPDKEFLADVGAGQIVDVGTLSAPAP